MSAVSLKPSGKASLLRRCVLGSILTVAAWLAVFGDKTPSSDASALSLPSTPAKKLAISTTSTAQRQSTQVKDETLSALIERPAAASITSKGRDVFASKNWNPPPPPAPMVVIAPTAPLLPYTYLGKKLENAAWEVYLSQGEKTFIAREGQTLEGVYRIDKIAPPMLALTYLPLAQAQTLPIGDSR